MPQKDTYQQKLTDAGFNIVEQTCNNPIANVWSITIHDIDCSLLSTNGNGISKELALNNVYEKFIGQLSTHYFWTDCYLGDEMAKNKFVHYPTEQWFQTNSNGSWPDDVLDSGALRDFYNPDGELNASKLIDINSSNHERGICCLSFETIGTGKLVNFPINIVTNLYSSNGISTSIKPEEARLDALLGIIEQYIKFKIISEGISLPEIPDVICNSHPDIVKSLKDIKEAGYELKIQDASLGGKYPVVALTLFNPRDQGVSMSFGAHPKLNIALQKSLMSLFQGCSDLTNLEDLPEPGFDMDEIASPQNLEKHFHDSHGIVAWKSLTRQSDYEFFDWNNKSSQFNSEIAFKILSEKILEDGNEIYISHHEILGTYTCRMIIPGLSEIYPTDDLVWENNNVGMEARNSILKTDKTVADCEQLIEDLEDLNQEDDVLISTLIGLPSDSDSIFTDLRIAELITLLALKTQDNERIQEGCEWLIHYKKINPRRLKVYQCINTILQLEGMTEYGISLEKLYTRPILKDALALIDGEDVFPLVSEWRSHSLLIDRYKRTIRIGNESY